MKKVVLALIIVAMISGRAMATLVYWDLNGTGTTGAGTTPTGAWSAAAANWNKDSNGDATMGALAGWVANDTAVFSAGSDATGAFTVTASGTPVAAGITTEEGTVTLSGRVDVNTGTVELKAGTLLSQASSGGATGTGITLTAGGKYAITGNATLRQTNAASAGSFVSSVGTIALSNNAALTVSYTTANSLSIIQTATVISGTGDLVKDGAGVIAIASPSTYTGSTTINNGELRIRSGANRLPIATAVTVNANGILNLNDQDQQIGSLSGSGLVGLNARTLTIDGSTNTTFSGSIRNQANAGAGAVVTGNGRVTKRGSGVLSLTGVNNFAGRLTLIDGGIVVAPGAVLSDAIADMFIDGGTLTLNNAAQTVENLTSTVAGVSSGTVVLGPGHTLTTDPVASTTFSGTITGPGGLVKANALSATTRRTLTLTGNNSYDGNTVITGGIISVGHDNALGSTAGYTEVNATSPLGAEVLFTGAGGSVTTNEPFRIAGAGSSNGGAIAVIAGATPIISGPVTLIGDTTLTVSAVSTVTYSNAAAITSLANQNLTLQGGSGAGGGGTISGAVNLGTGSLTKLQGGKWVLSGANTYSGGTTIGAGTLLVNNTTGSGTGSGPVAVNAGTLGGTGTIAGPVTVADGGTVAPGTSPGTLTVNNSFVLNPASTLAFELSGTNTTVGGGVNDLIDGVTNLTLDGILNVSETVPGSFLSAAGGSSWRLINYSGTLTDNGLALGSMPSLSSGLFFQIDTATLGQINLTAVPEASAFVALGLVGLLSAGVVWIRKRRAGAMAA